MARPINYYKKFHSLAKALCVTPNQLCKDLLISEETLKSWETPGTGPSKQFIANMIGYIGSAYHVMINEKLEIVGWHNSFPFHESWHNLGPIQKK